MILAYVDPGLGALVWQTVISAFVGFLFYLKKTRRWIVNLFWKIFGSRPIEPKSTPPVVESAEINRMPGDAVVCAIIS